MNFMLEWEKHHITRSLRILHLNFLLSPLTPKHVQRLCLRRSRNNSKHVCCHSFIKLPRCYLSFSKLGNLTVKFNLT